MSSSESEEADLKPIKSETLKKQAPAPDAVYHNFLNANNKFTEMLKNKIKQSGISPIGKNTFNDSNYDFNPVASSTQIGTPNEVKHARKNLPTNSRALKPNKPSSYRESSSDEDTKTIKKPTIIEISSTVAGNITSSEDSDDSKRKKTQTHLKKHEASDKSTSNTDSDDSSQQNRQVKSKKNNIKEIRKTSSVNTNKKRTKKKEVTSDVDSSDSEKARMILPAQKKTHKRKNSFSSGSEEIMSKSIVQASASSSSEEEVKENPKSGKKNLKKADSTSSSDSEEKNKGVRPQKQIKEKKPLKTRKNTSSSSSYSSSDEFVAEKVKNQIGSPDERLKSYEKEASLQRIRDTNNFLNKVKPREELYLLQVPIKLDPNSLVGINISLSEQMRIPQHKKYESVPSPKSQETLSLFSNDDDERIHIVKPMGYIKIQRHLKKQLVANASEFDDNPVLFPNDLKERHPLFGSDFTNKINLEENIKQKLAAAVESYNRKKKKDAKEKKKKNSTGDLQEEEEIFKFLSQTSDGSTSKKANNSMNESGNFQETYSEHELDPSTSYGCKKKKKKKDKRNRSVDEEDSTNRKKRKQKDLDSDVTVTKARKFESPNESSLIQQLLFNETETLYKKKKKKRKKSEVEDE